MRNKYEIKWNVGLGRSYCYQKEKSFPKYWKTFNLGCERSSTYILLIIILNSKRKHMCQGRRHKKSCLGKLNTQSHGKVGGIKMTISRKCPYWSLKYWMSGLCLASKCLNVPTKNSFSVFNKLHSLINFSKLETVWVYTFSYKGILSTKWGNIIK